jgi:hypothetical protein
MAGAGLLMGASALAQKWGGEIGRPVGAEAVRRELERLSLTTAAGVGKRAARTK